MDKSKTYYFGLDCVRIIALLFVFGLHYMLRNGFYYMPVNTFPMLVMSVMRIICMCCIPLFMILTGYLKCGKEWKEGYYYPLVKINVSRILIGFICLGIHIFYLKESMTVYQWVARFMDFKLPDYAWYINMYIGIFLLSPFINLLWNNLKTENMHIMLVGILGVLTILADVLNSIKFDGETTLNFLPNYWTYLYPFMYYLIGCYIATYKPKIKFRWGGGISLLIAIWLAFINYATGGHSENFYAGYNISYGHLGTAIMAICLFLAVYHVDCEEKKFQSMARGISSVTLEAYLCSSIFDIIIYKKGIESYTPGNLVKQAPLRIGMVFVCSCLLGWFISVVSRWLSEKIIFLFQNRWYVRKSVDKYLNKVKMCNKDAFIIGLFVIAGFFLLWKCRYGFGDNDEAFYLTIPYRLYQGDALFTEEWHLSQMAGFLLLPFMTIYMKITQNTEGIILAFRYLYVIIQIMTACFLYVRLRSYSRISAGIAAIGFMLYAPFGIMALSYNSMGILFMALSMVILLTAQKKRYFQYICAGILFAAAVLCCPYLAFMYLLYACTVLCVYASRPNIKLKGCWQLFSLKGWLYVTLGITFLAIIFFGFVFSRSSLQEILEMIPYIINDPEHANRSIWGKTQVYFQSIFYRTQWTIYIYLIMGILLGISQLKRSRKEVKLWCWLCACVLIWFMMIKMYSEGILINSVMLPINVLALYSFLIAKDKRITKIFCFIWVPGMLYSFCLNLSSNQTYLAIESASVVAYLGSVLIIFLIILKFLQDEKRKLTAYISLAFIVVLLGTQLGLECYLRYDQIFWDTSVKNQTQLITTGPEAGIYVSAQDEQYYLNVTEGINWDRAGKIACITNSCWINLMNEWEICIYSAWLSGTNEYTLERLSQYYQMNPQKIPDVIFLERSSEIDPEWFVQNMDYMKQEENEFFYVLQK